MGSRETYIHGTDPSEQERLSALNRMTNDAFVRFLALVPGTRALEVGSGLGILAAAVASSAEDVHVFGLERSREQLTAAVRAPGISFVLGDAHHLCLADGSVDLVYARCLLEHVAQPEQVVREMRRVVRRGGRVAACENDVALLRIDPPCPTFEDVWAAFQRYQQTLGGDALIGRRLHRLLKGAGFSRIELSVQPEVHWYGSPGFDWWMRNIIGNVESARRGLLDSKLSDARQIDRAVAELDERRQQPDASSCFVWNRATAAD